jgi:hypothetical protein
MTRLRAAELRAAIADRIGCPAGANDDQLLAALDIALTRRPDGTELIDTEALAELQAQAEVGRTHRQRNLVEGALRAGKIRAEAAAPWQSLLQTDPASAEAALAALPANTIPTARRGYGDDDNDDGDEALLGQVYPELTRKHRNGNSNGRQPGGN